MSPLLLILLIVLSTLLFICCNISLVFSLFVFVISVNACRFIITSFNNIFILLLSVCVVGSSSACSSGSCSSACSCVCSSACSCVCSSGSGLSFFSSMSSCSSFFFTFIIMGVSAFLTIFNNLFIYCQFFCNVSASATIY